MCQIDFTIQFTDQDNSLIQAAEGRYKLQSDSVFEPVFSIDITDPKTPDLNVNGDYDLDVRIQDEDGLWSNWFSTTFLIADTCP